MSELEHAPDPEQLERLRAAFAASASVDVAHGEAIAPERIWAAARGELDAQETAAIVDRLHRDPQLALEWRLAVELSEHEHEHASATDAELTPIRAAPQRRAWIAAAVALATAAAVSIVVLQDGGSTELDTDTTPPGLRGGEDTEGDEAALSTSIAEHTRMARTGFELSWSTRAGVSRYELQVRTEALDPVYETHELQAAHARVPADVLVAVEPGQLLIWQVTAVMADGTREPGPVWHVVLE